MVIGEFANTSLHEFTTPDLGEYLDWVLDDASKKFTAPGVVK